MNIDRRGATYKEKPLSLARALAALVVLAGAAVAASVPNIMTYQGRLKESGSLVTGTRSVEIYLCDLPTGGSCYSASGPQNVSVISGIFKSTFSVAGVINLGNPPWYVDVRVAGTPLTPREQLTTTPYAFVSSTTLSVNAADVKAGTLGSGVILAAGQLGSGVLGSGVHFSDKVGVGMTNPLFKFGVAVNNGSSDGIEVTNSGTNCAAVRLISADAGGRQWEVCSAGSSNTSGPGKLSFYDATLGGVAGYRMVIDAAGNVGVGLTNPAYKLDVQGDIRATGMINGTLGSGVLLPAAQVQAGTLGSGVLVSAGNIGSGVLGTGIHFVNSVGIGTTQPAGKLHVIGEGVFQRTGNPSFILGLDAAGNNRFAINSDPGPSLGFYGLDGGWFEFMHVDNAGSKAVGFSAGNVGIGLTNPAAKLVVAGRVGLTGPGSPTPGAGCGTGAGIVGTDSLGRVTIGTGPGATCVVNFSASWSPMTPVCFLNSSANPVRVTAATANTFTIGGTIANTDAIDFVCLGR
ncbi:MAG: hypothetical protein HY927_05720 [Elusimicrobia bacterium]|nr:hypothetical protein [Elusimicrobiota bacterium]